MNLPDLNLPVEEKQNYGIQVSLRKLFSENGIPVLRCCPECKSTLINFRVLKQKWHCRVCQWRGPEPILKVGYPSYHNVFFSRVVESAKRNKLVLKQAVEEKIAMPVELLEVLEGEV